MGFPMVYVTTIRPYFPTGVKNMGDEEVLQNLMGGGGLESIHGGVWGA